MQTFNRVLKEGALQENKTKSLLSNTKLAFSDAVDSLVPALLNAMAATGESWAGIMVTAL